MPYNEAMILRTHRRSVALGLILVLAVATAACRPAPSATRLGIFIPNVGNGHVASATDIVTEAGKLGVHVVRVGEASITDPTPNPRLATFARAGLDVVMTVRNNPTIDANGNSVTAPIRTDAELATYRMQLGALLDRYRPKLLMIENEELDDNYFSGTPEEYLRQLNTAIEVAHTHGVEVTDGGITTRALSLLVWGDYHDRHLDAQAADFARRAFDRPGDASVRNDLLRVPFQGLRNVALAQKWDDAKRLVPGEAASGLDYVDFHWYGDDPGALRESIDYLKRVTGKPIVTTEIGQWDSGAEVNARQVTSELGVLTDEQLPYALWFDNDGDPAVGLHNDDWSLRDSGNAFAAFTAAHPQH